MNTQMYLLILRSNIISANAPLFAFFILKK